MRGRGIPPETEPVVAAVAAGPDPEVEGNKEEEGRERGEPPKGEDGEETL